MNILHRSAFLFTSIVLAASITNAENVKELPAECKSNCISTYGKHLGTSKKGIHAYSNCNSKCVIFEPNKWEGTYTGIKWQCVEYARRWLLINKGMVYGDVDTASDIWNKIPHLIDISSNQKIPLETHLNGSNNAPKVGDLLIYAREYNGTGHVAVVIDVDYELGEIELGEQNYDNKIWPKDYARKIELIENNGVYWLLDRYLLGWKHINN